MTLRQLKGTKEFLPKEQLVREWIADTLKRVFKIYGFKPVETSILEFYDIAASKYAGGAEILKETYRLKDQGNRDLILRYELTFKLAKLIGMNPEIRMPFKRYEIGKVFRDGPVKTGRLREFTQCDVDVVGIKSQVANAELIALAFRVFQELGLNAYAQVNSRKLLFGILKEFGVDEDKFTDFALSLDKIEKVGKEAVVKELREKEFNEDVIVKVFSVLEEAGKFNGNTNKLDYFTNVLNNELAKEGISELKDLFNFLKDFNVSEVELTPNLARGLGYYTGTIFEFYLKDSKIKSSIAAGGTWDSMIQKFIGTKIEYPATGMAFGLDVIYEALKDSKINITNIPKIYIIPINTLKDSIKICEKIRSEGISCDIAYTKKLGKALNYANKEGIPYCLIVGEDELKKGKYKLKDMRSGDERFVSVEELISLSKKSP